MQDNVIVEKKQKNKQPNSNIKISIFATLFVIVIALSFCLVLVIPSSASLEKGYRLSVIANNSLVEVQSYWTGAKEFENLVIKNNENVLANNWVKGTLVKTENKRDWIKTISIGELTFDEDCSEIKILLVISNLEQNQLRMNLGRISGVTNLEISMKYALINSINGEHNAFEKPFSDYTLFVPSTTIVDIPENKAVVICVSVNVVNETKGVKLKNPIKINLEKIKNDN